MASSMVQTHAADAGANDNIANRDPNVAFATDLLFHLDDVRANCTTSLAAHANLITMLQSRINLERTYAQELSKMAHFSHCNEMEHGTMETAMANLTAQYLNTSVQHEQLAKNLEEDVLKPIESLYRCNSDRSQSLTRQIKNAKKDVKIQEDAYRKVYRAFDKTFRVASASFSDAMASGFSSTLIEDQYHRRLSQIKIADSPAKKHSVIATVIRPDKSSGTVALKTVNNNKLVSWLLSSGTHRKEDLAKNTVELMEAAEKARRICQHSWQTVETHRIKMYRVVQAVLADYQQMAEDHISTISTNLRKHVIFASSTLANEQYDWQMIAPLFETVDVKGDICDFVHATRGNKSRVDYLCNDTTCALISSPSSKPCQPLRKTCLEIRDISSKRIPFDYDGNQELLSKVLDTYHLIAQDEMQNQQRRVVHDHEPQSYDGYACAYSMPSLENDIVGITEITTSIKPRNYNGVCAQLEDKNSIIQRNEPDHNSDESLASVSSSTRPMPSF
ncbi:unnamed protein product [Peronospora destructor]|uniref:FCH domain-containing protein n=1 Tax=Peronospora destructor TaxID=86335 RepID=A0AAV0U5H5_9STRA|nr:unnamed protein product [Peronospora destructor]